MVCFAYTIPKLIVMQRPIFSVFFISSFQVIHHGKKANTKSITMLYTSLISIQLCQDVMATDCFRLP